VTPDLLAAVAVEHRRGRRLFVATTSLDTQAQVIWDMGALATSGDPGTLDRFIDILTASASIPGVFPPVFIEMRRGDLVVRELHADGRTTANFFLVPEQLMAGRLDLPRSAEGTSGRLWIIINGRPETRFRVTPFGGVDVASRGLDSMMKASTRMNVIASRQFALLNDMAVAVAMAPPTGLETSLDFDRARMRALFEAGHTAALADAQWVAGGQR
jgi:predicted acylesterase/phospholipase RssA